MVGRLYRSFPLRFAQHKTDHLPRRHGAAFLARVLSSPSPPPLFLQIAPAGEGRKVVLAETHFIVSSPPLSSVGLCLGLSVGSAIGELCCPTQTFYVFVQGNLSF